MLDHFVLALTRMVINQHGREALIKKGGPRFIVDTLFLTMPPNPPDGLLDKLIHSRVHLETLVAGELGVERLTTIPNSLTNAIAKAIMLFAKQFGNNKLKRLEPKRIIDALIDGPPLEELNDVTSYCLQSEVIAYQPEAIEFFNHYRESYLNGEKEATSLN